MGYIARISGPLVAAEDMIGTKMYDVVRVGGKGLIGEIIQLRGSRAMVQVYEDTTVLRPGEPVVSTNELLSVELGPGYEATSSTGLRGRWRALKRRVATSSPWE